MSQFLKKLEDQAMQASAAESNSDEEEKGATVADLPPRDVQPGSGATAMAGGSSGISAAARFSALRQQQFEQLTWETFFDYRQLINETVPVYTAGSAGHLFLCLHGAGSSALTFAALAEQMKATSTVLAFDWRGHGGHTRPDEADLSVGTLIQDTLEVLQYVCTTYPGRSIILVGHAMGGAIAAKAMHHIETQMAESDLQKSIQGLIMVDITDGIAKNALPHMDEVIDQRPSSFPDVVSAIRYGVMSKQVKNRRSAAVSMPALVLPTQDANSGEEKFVWRTDLATTMPFWEQWFADLNACYMGLQVRKWLFLAKKDDLDDQLYGQAEAGKFSPVFLPNVGHYVHEDSPDKMAQAIVGMLTQRKVPVEWNTQVFIINAAGKKVLISR